MQGTSEITVAVNHAATLQWIIGGLIFLIMALIGYVWKGKDTIDDELKRDMKVLLDIIPKMDSKIDSIQREIIEVKEDFKDHKKDYFGLKEKVIELWTIHKQAK